MILEIISGSLMLIGALLAVVAGAGLQRFQDVFARMHAATKPATLGLVLIVSGAALQVGDPGEAEKLVLVAVLQFLTAPVAGHMMGRAAYRRGVEASPALRVDELADHAGRAGRLPSEQEATDREFRQSSDDG